MTCMRDVDLNYGVHTYELTAQCNALCPKSTFLCLLSRLKDPSKVSEFSISQSFLTLFILFSFALRNHMSQHPACRIATALFIQMLNTTEIKAK